nr:OmpA family protein [Streptomyces coryli]
MAVTALAIGFLASGVTFAGPVTAAPAPTSFKEQGSSAPEVDEDDSDLKLPGDAPLDKSKILDIKSIVESEGGEERREDTNEKIKFALQAEVLFPKDSAKLNSKALGRIEAIAEEIKKQNATKVNVFGFTDNLGSYGHGKTLSKQRAQAVQKQLGDALGADITYQVRGYSEDYPIASNNTEEGRKKNRRVEISFPRSQ